MRIHPGWFRLLAVVFAMAVIGAGCTGQRPELVEIGAEERAGIDALATQGPVNGSPVVGENSTEGGGNLEIPAVGSSDSTTEVNDGSEAGVGSAGAETIDEGCLSDRQWIAQTMMALATPEEFVNLQPLADAGEIGGLVMLGTPGADIKNQLASLNDAGPVRLLMASDEEGGLVQRLSPVLGPLPSAEEQAASMSTAEVQEMFTTYGSEMKALGFDVAFAPVVDIGGGPGIGDRSYGSDPAMVIEYAQAVAAGYQAAGIQPVFKHFPGHGRASADSHISLPTTPPYADLLTLDLVPYDTLLNLPGAAVMVGHLSVPGLSDETPTSLSQNTVSLLLRGTGGETFEGKSYNFGGLVFSDAMNMGAVTDAFSIADIAVTAVRIGTDVVLIGGGAEVTAGIDAIASALADGRLDWATVDASVGRILTLKGRSDLSRCSAA